MYYVYVLESLKNHKYYVGYTNDLEKRLSEHNTGKTKGNRYSAPFKLIYYEEYSNPTEARKREHFIKSQKSRKFIEKLVLGKYSLNTSRLSGPVAQLGEHHNGIVGVVGSIPIRSSQA